MTDFSSIETPSRVWAREEVLLKPYPVPQESGLYAWYFRELPHRELERHDIRCTLDMPALGHLSLLYVGIAPVSRTSNENLRKRLRKHYAGTARRSTLRLSLGSLLCEKLRLTAVLVDPARNKIDFGLDEEKLSRWMGNNAFAVWMEYSKPWEIEREAIAKYRPLLNLDDFPDNPFGDSLRNSRSAVRKAARDQ